MSCALLLALLQTAAPALPSTPPADSLPRPFAVGETLRYTAKLGILHLGDGALSVARLDTVRGAPTYVFQFRLRAQTVFYHADDLLESWSDTATIVSHRFRQDFVEKGKHRLRGFEIYPAEHFYRQEGKPDTHPTPDHPVDDAGFFYLIRTIPLEVGKTYVLDRYFQLDKNPIRIEVVGREQMELPDGSKVSCLVLHPVVPVEGMFSSRSNTRLWLTDDARRIPVQIRTRFPFGTVTLHLEAMTLGIGAPARPAEPDSATGQP